MESFSMPTEPGEVARLAEDAGLALSAERCAIVAGALDSFAPILESFSGVDVDDDTPPPVFDARW
jgi:hypothetical protein